MTPSTWQLAKQIFDEAREIAAADRQVFLDRKCGGDAELRGEVEKLLSFYDSDFLEETALDAAEALVNPSLADGQVIGRYRIGKLIGSGGMGQVFLAEDTELGRPVAFKVLHHDVGADDERLRRFVQEARAASALNHPNILTIHEIGSFEGFRFIVSEYIDGETLRERMRRGLKTEESVEITCQITAALNAAHAAGIVHRDIKPENVMLRGDGLVKVLDFGLAKLTEADDRPIDANATVGSHLQTSPGLIMGTAAYMSPEQARGQAVDARTDLWSLGVVFHEMLTGKSPFAGETVTQLIKSILKTDLTEALSDGLPDELQPICRKALAKDKDSRYQSAHDLLKDLEGEKKRMEYSTHPTPYVTVSSTNELKTQLIRPRPTLSAEYIFEGVRTHKLATSAIALMVIVVGIGFSVYKFNGASPAALEPTTASLIGPSTTEADLRMSRVPSSGRIVDIAISPDGKYVAYVTTEGAGKQGVRLLQLATSADVEIVPAPSSGNLEDLSFSPDGNYLYYVQSKETTEEIHRVPALGGHPTKITDDTVCGAGVSPDGKTLAFHRKGTDKSNNLVVAGPDGSNERIVAKSGNPADRFWCGYVPTWSPDGKEIACWSDHEEKNDKFQKLFALNVADGSRRALSDKRWSEVESAVYMSDGSLLISGQERAAETLEAQLWLIAPNLEPKRITTGPNSYSMISTTRDGNVVVTLQTITRNDLWVLPKNDVGRARQVTSSGEVRGGFEWMPDGKLILASNLSGAINIWTMNADGSGRRQLTRDQGQNVFPTVSPDGKTIIFQSTGADTRSHIFRMDADGSNLKQLTSGEGAEARPRISLDGKWIFYYHRNEKRAPNFRILRIPIQGGEPLEVTTIPEGWTISALDLSPVDGRIAYLASRRVNQAFENTIDIIAPNGRPIRTLPLPPTGWRGFIRWTPDGRAIAFNDNRDKSGDVWTIPVNGKPTPRRLTNFRTPVTYNFDWTQDGKQLVLSRGTSTRDAVLISSIR